MHTTPLVRCNFCKLFDGAAFRLHQAQRSFLPLLGQEGLTQSLPRPLAGDSGQPPRRSEGKNRIRASSPPRGTNGGVHLKLIRRNAVTHTIGQTKSSSTRGVYLFYEKTSGTAHFHIEAGPDGELPVDHAAGLLAMHCMVRGQSPSDYMIMVPAPAESVNGL